MILFGFIIPFSICQCQGIFMSYGCDIFFIIIFVFIAINDENVIKKIRLFVVVFFAHFFFFQSTFQPQGVA